MPGHGTFWPQKVSRAGSAGVQLSGQDEPWQDIDKSMPAARVAVVSGCTAALSATQLLATSQFCKQVLLLLYMKCC